VKPNAAKKKKKDYVIKQLKMFSYVKNIEMNTDEPLVPEPSSCEAENC
jgi:hypothetical protein